MDDAVNRREMVERVFPNATRIPGFVVSGPEALEGVLEPPYSVAPRENRTFAEFTAEAYNAQPGELGCLIAHLEAVEQLMKHEVALIVEDDFGLHFCRAAPTSVLNYVHAAERADPEWELLRLSWGKVKPDAYFDQLRSYAEGVAEFHGRPVEDVYASMLRTYGDWREGPLVAHRPKTWGTVATVYHRRGMVRTLMAFRGDETKYRCPSSVRCCADCYMDEVHGEHALVTTPPVLPITMREYISDIRGDSLERHGRDAVAHSQYNANAAHWYVELMEFLKSAGAYEPPAQWRVVPAHWPASEEVPRVSI